MPRFADLAGCGCLGAGADDGYMPDADYSYAPDYGLDVMPDDYTPQGELGRLAETGGTFEFTQARPPLSVPESEWPVGSIATLVAPFVADSGSAWVQDQTVQRFKKFAPGRWSSIPGNLVYYTSLGALDLAAPVKQVYYPPPPKPSDPQPQPQPKKEGSNQGGLAPWIPTVFAGDLGPPITDLDNIPGGEPARPAWLLPAVAIGAALVLIPLFNRRRRR